MRSSSFSPAESAAAVCSKRLLGVSLSVLRRCAPRFQSKAPRAPDGRAEPALPVERAALALGPQRGRLSGGGAPRLQAHDARERVGPVEAAGRAAHDLDPLQLEGQRGAEVVGAARLVDRHAVDHHARVARLAAADEHGALLPRLAAARRRDARHVLQQRQQRRRRAVVDLVALEHVHAHAERRQRGLAARGAHHHALRDGRGRSTRSRVRLGLADRDCGAVAQLQAGRVDEQAVGAGREGRDAERPVGPGRHAANAVGALERPRRRRAAAGRRWSARPRRAPRKAARARRPRRPPGSRKRQKKRRSTMRMVPPCGGLFPGDPWALRVNGSRRAVFGGMAVRRPPVQLLPHARSL